MKGDRVEIVIDAGGSTRTYDIVATRAGRRVETTHGRGLVEVTEVTRGGTPVRTGRFMASRLIALVEHPARERDDARVEVVTRRRLGGREEGGRSSRRPTAPPQPALFGEPEASTATGDGGASGTTGD